MTSRLRKHMRDKIARLSVTEHEEIFKILDEHKVDYTQNMNGTFFDISTISEEVFSILEKFVDFCISNKKELDEYDKKINECKLKNNYDKLQKVSTPLNTVMNNVEQENWQEVMNDVKKSEKVLAFVNLLENNTDRLNIKKTNTKFINTKKKYSKKSVGTGGKGDTELPNNLSREPYRI